MASRNAYNYEGRLYQTRERAIRTLEETKRLLKLTEENIQKSRAILTLKRRTLWEPEWYVVRDEERRNGRS